MYDPTQFQTIRDGIKDDLPDHERMLAQALVSVAEQITHSLFTISVSLDELVRLEQERFKAGK